MSAIPRTGSLPRAERESPDVKVWDIAVRVFHWSMVACFAGLWLTAESERFRDVHVALGWGMAGLLAFRVLWGFLGTRHARFSNFVRGPSEVGLYLASLLSARPQRHLGHNPAGAVAILLMLAVAAATIGAGWTTLNDLGGEWVEELHEFLAHAMLAVVVVHVAGVAVSSWLHRENLVAAMLTGRKRRPRESD